MTPVQEPFTPVEKEAIILNAVWEMIDGMVNYAMFVKYDEITNTNLLFQTSAHMRLFNILLGDFLSLPQKRGVNPLPFGLPDPPRDTRPSDLTFLFYLRQVCESPQLGGDVDMLRKPVEAFATWLEGNTFVEKVWLPAIDTELDIEIMRITYIKICGDIGKHSFARLQGNVNRICKVLADNGRVIDEGAGFSVLPEFYEWFHTNVFAAQSSAIAEFLNNIRWAIYEYVRPEFMRSFERVDPAPMYRFNYPPNVANSLAKEMYWGLMNMARSPPYFPKFTISDSFKNHFCR